MKVITLLLLSLLLLVPPVASQVADDKLITPGQGIGKWTLTMTVDDLVKMNGSSYKILEENQGNLADLRLSLQVYCWRVASGTGNFHASFSDQKRVEYLSTDGSQLKTKEGIGVFSPRPAVEAAYGKPTAITNTASYSDGPKRLIYDKIGIAFQLDSGGVQYLFVFRPGTAETIWKF